MSRKFFPIIKYLIGWPLSALALIFVFKVVFTNFENASKSITHINLPILGLGIAFFIAYFLLRGFLWMLILGDHARHFNFKENLLYWSLSELKRYVPGSVWSFASRATQFEKGDLTKKQVIIYIAHEAILICLSSLIFSLFYIRNLSGNQIITSLIIIICIFFSIVFIFGNAFIKKTNIGERAKAIFNLFLPAGSYFSNFKILMLGISTFFTYGLASYFSAVSIYYIDLRHFMILISLFVFAYFVGYISIITPMGLGVREGVTVFGLLSYLSQVAAATVSIFVRTISIVSEILSIGLIVLLNKIKSQKLQNIEDFIYNHKQEIILSLFVLVYISYFTIASFLRYSNFYTGRFDLGNMDQTVWNTIHGRIFQLTDPDGTENILRLSVHADFILVLISPLYLIWSSPKTLLLFQTIVLGMGAFFVYLIAKEILKNKNISLAFASSYLLNPALGFTNLYDFHPVTLATTFLLGTFYFFIKKRLWPFLFFAMLSGSVKEEAWAVVGFFGIYYAIEAYLKNRSNIAWKKILIGVAFFVVGGITTFILIAKVIPFFRGGNHFALAYYSDFGYSPLEILKNLLLNPIKTLSTLFQRTRISYLTELLGPLGFLSLLSPFILIFALPDLLIDLLSNNPQLHQIYYQYSAVITPFIFISAVYGARFLVNKVKIIKLTHISFYILLSTLIMLYYVGPLPGTARPNIDMFSKQIVNSSELNRYLSSIPMRYSIASTNNLGSHLSRRQHIYTIPAGLDRADYIIFLADHGYSPQSLKEQQKMIDNLLKDPNYVLDFKDKDFFAFKKTRIKQEIKI